MQTFAQKQNQSQKPVASSLARPKMATPGPDHREHPLLHLQRTIGNQAVLRMLQTRAEEPEVGLTGTASPRFGHDFSQIPIHSPAVGAIQAKLAINRPGDEYEQEAHRVSEQVMRMSEPQLQRACAGAHPKCQTAQPGQEQERLQTKSVVQPSDTGQIAAPPIVHEVLAAPGQPLDAGTRAFMEPRFGHDFSRVRVHSDAVAERSVRAVNANAYTVGHNIVFGAGRFAPGTHEGRRLITHELTHVVQQSGADGMNVGQSNDKRSLSPIAPVKHPPDSAAPTGEAAAALGLQSSAGNRAVAGLLAGAVSSSPLRLARESKQQQWEKEFKRDYPHLENVGREEGPRDAGVLTETGIRVPIHYGDFLTPRPFYERKVAALLAYQGFIHYAELVEAGHDPAAVQVALARNPDPKARPPRDSELDLDKYAGWSRRAVASREGVQVALFLAELAELSASLASRKALPPGASAPKQLEAGPPPPKQLEAGPPPPKQLEAGPPPPKQLTSGSTRPETLSEVNLPSRVRAAGGRGLKDEGRFFGWETARVTKTAKDFTKEELLSRGWTRERLSDLAEGYEHITRITPKNLSAPGRAQQIREIIKRLFD